VFLLSTNGAETTGLHHHQAEQAKQGDPVAPGERVTDHADGSRDAADYGSALATSTRSSLCNVGLPGRPAPIGALGLSLP
jgi:hypothetical protein